MIPVSARDTFGLGRNTSDTGDSKIPETQAETDPLNDLLTTSDTVGPLLSIHFIVGYVVLCSTIRACLHHPRIKAHSAARLMEFPPIWKRGHHATSSKQ